VRERVRLEHVQATALPFDDGRFHTVVLDDRLAHLLEPAKTIGEMRRVVREDGTALLSVRIGVRRHDGHLDEMGAHRVAAAIAPCFVLERAELLGPYLMLVARPGSSEPEQLAARLLDVTDARLRELEHAHLAALDELARTRRDLDDATTTLEAETARANRLKRRFEQQRQHWSWQMAVALREARRSPWAFLALPFRLLTIVLRRRRAR